MARIKINLPEDFKYSTKIPVRITDLNYSGHVGNDSILSLIHEARVQYLASMGYSEMNFEGAGLIMADVGIEFSHELFYEGNLQVKVAAGDFQRVSFDMYYLLESVNDEKTTIIAKAKTGMVCYDYKLKKVISVPQKAIEKLI